jgi:catechol 2,3-dioxygenase-like lactoylglutathione lyase family enzyme
MIPRLHALIFCASACAALFAWASGQGAVKPPSGPRLFRVIVPVADIERGAAFYTELLGIQGQRVSGGRHYFDCGGVILALLSPQGDGDAGEARPLPDHVYFAVADLEACHARAAALDCLSSEVGDGGLAMGEIQVRPWGERSFYVHDPLGTPLCFVDETTLFTGRR